MVMADLSVKIAGVEFKNPVIGFLILRAKIAFIYHISKFSNQFSSKSPLYPFPLPLSAILSIQ